MVSYKLIYFNSRGNGENARQIFAVAGKEFEDVRISKEDWPALKDSTPFGQLPVLEVDGKQLPQSLAISRYLAREFRLNGQNAWEEAQINALVDQFKDYCRDIRPYAILLRTGETDDLSKLREEVFIPAVAKNFNFFRNYLSSSGSGYFVGNSLTWVDLLIAQHVADVLEKEPEALNNFPEILEHLKKVHSNENLKKWLDTRPQTN